jgi:hypothetical protein
MLVVIDLYGRDNTSTPSSSTRTLDAAAWLIRSTENRQPQSIANVSGVWVRFCYFNNLYQGVRSVRFMIIVKATKTSETGVLPSPQLLEDMGKFNQQLVEAGVMIDGGGLRPTSMGARVTFSGKDRAVSKGPFSNTNDLVAGYWIWKLDSLDEAIEWVKRCPNPMPETSEIEIRQFFEMEDFAGIKANG